MNSPATIRQLSAAEAHALWAESYDRRPNPLLVLEERIVGELLPPLENMCTLDVACGTGRWLANMLHRRTSFSVGLDFSPEMLKEAQRKPPLHDRLIRADCEAIPLISEMADLAICSFAVGYVPHLSLFARELSRTLKKWGHLFISDFHPSAHVQGWKRTFRHDGTIVEVASVSYSVADICDAFTVAGFELVTRVEPCFGEAERQVFVDCGKEHLLGEFSGIPAIFACHFRKMGIDPNKRK